jgi:hypothetical protein
MKANEFELPNKAANSHWEDIELSFFKQALSENLSGQEMVVLHPSRSIRAFEGQAKRFGLGISKDEHGDFRFVKDYKFRKKRNKVDENIISEVANDEVETVGSSTDIIANPKTNYTEADAELDIKIATAEASLRCFKKLKATHERM